MWKASSTDLSRSDVGKRYTLVGTVKAHDELQGRQANHRDALQGDPRRLTSTSTVSRVALAGAALFAFGTDLSVTISLDSNYFAVKP